MNCFSHLLRTILLAVVLLHAGLLAAQTYPSKPIRVVVPFAPGGSNDVVMRILAPRLSEELGQTVIVDNRPGAGSTIGLDIVAKSAPDGYTLGLASLSFGANPFVIAKMPFDTEKDFAPVSQLALVPLVLVVHPSLPARSVKELITMAKDKPATINYGSAGNASVNHLATELFTYMTGAKMMHIPYKGGGPAVSALLGGEISVLMATVPSSVHQIKTGRLIPLAVTTAQRDPSLPDVPTIAEAGVPGYELYDWIGVLAPAGTPSAVINRLNQAFVKTLALAAVKESIAKVGAHPVGGTPEELNAFIKKELSTWAKVVKAADIRPN